MSPIIPPQAKPLVLVPACNRMLGEHPFHIAGRKYVEAVRLAGALPIVLPRLEAGEFDTLLDTRARRAAHRLPFQRAPFALWRKRARP
jgi:putative glutamine amidotransferase